jgi:hypothetical protein
MEIWPVIATHVAGPVVLLLIVIAWRPSGRQDAIGTTAAALLLLAYLWFAGRWHLASIWLRYVLPIVAVGILAVGASRQRRLPSRSPGSVYTWLLRAMTLAVIVFAGLRLRETIQGRNRQSASIALQFPLRGGTFYVGQGGSTPAVNYHSGNRTQRYALDVVKLTSLGNRATRLQPVRLDEYASFGSPVYAPCSGRVQISESSLVDNLPGSDKTRPAGNHIVLRCDGTDADVILAHLQQATVRVAAGDHVTAGAHVGAIGASGNTAEPHLHIHAKRGGDPRSSTGGEGVPITFDGAFLVRNDIVQR